MSLRDHRYSTAVCVLPTPASPHMANPAVLVVSALPLVLTCFLGRRCSSIILKTSRRPMKYELDWN